MVRLEDRRGGTVSVVIPVVNEERFLATCLESVSAQEQPFETLVVDGGSGDSTREIARSRGIQVLRSRRGRAAQMNAGAAATSGETLLFLHADTLLPDDALARIRAAVRAGVDCGGFAMRYDCRRASSQLAAGIATLYSRVTLDLFGDRAIFVTREAFERVGGYREIPLMEDLDLSVRLRRSGHRATVLPGPVVTSARRLEKVGIWRAGWWAWRLTRSYHRGGKIDPAAERFYGLEAR